MPLESQGSQDTSFVVPNLPPGVKADCDPIPQPAPALPHHHAPKIPPGGRYPIVNSNGGKAFPIATAVLFEDEEIIVWENRQAPGMQGPLHSHEHDYWALLSHNTSMREHKTMVRRADSNPPYKEVSLPGGGGPGGVIFIKKGHLETATGSPDTPAGVAYLVEIKKPEEGGKVALSPPGWGASAGVLFENTEVKIWDMRVPAGQKGSIAPEKGNAVGHVDIRGRRHGAMNVSELLNVTEGQETQGGARKSFMEAYLFQKKKWGTTYFLPAGSEAMGPDGGRAGEAVNDGTEDYRGVLIEVKPGPPQITARL